MRISIRAKLILVMAVVVAGATIGTALVSQGVVRKSYEERFKNEFKAEVRFFSERQLNRLDEMRVHCRELVEKVPLINAVTKSDKPAIQASILGDLREFYTGSNAQPFASGRGGMPPPRESPGVGSQKTQKGAMGLPPRPAGGSAAGAIGKLARGALALMDRPLVAVTDADGDLICMLDGDGKLLGREDIRPLFGKVPRLAKGKDEPAEQRREGRNDQIRQTLKRMAQKVTDEQEIAYSTATDFDGKEHLREVIVTPIRDASTDRVAGALIVSMLMSDLGERALESFSRETDADPRNGRAETIRSGFWLDGKVHSETIPQSSRDAVSALVAQRVEKARESGGFHEATMSLESAGSFIPHRVIFRVLNPGSSFPPACQVALYSLRDELADERDVQARILSIGLLALAVALLLILVITRHLVSPVRELVAGTAQIRAGNYDVNVNADRRDEFGELAASFNEMAAGLRLNQKYQRLLSQVADRLVAEQLMNNEAALGGELREVTVMFCDIRGFTKLTTGMPPSEVIAMLNEHMSALTAMVHDHHGVVDKFVGDMLMALFGAPSTHGDDARRAAMCALRMVQARDELNVSGPWHVQIGIGIATGQVVAGCMGSMERLDYTVLGERVNLASRLCDQAGPGEVLIDEATLSRLGNAAEVDEREQLELKGFDSAITAYRLTAWKESVEVGARSTPLVVDVEPVPSHSGSMNVAASHGE